MRTFRCTCGARIFFENTRCLACRRELGFLPDVLSLEALEARGSGSFSTPRGDYRKCSNYVDEGVCNWMVPASASEALCQACQLNHVIPNLSQPENRTLWAETEKAKRRLIYSLNQLKLPLHSKHDDQEGGLAFDIKADVGSTRVLTGHEDGLITLNVAEANAAEREKMRLAMKEGYRTLLGHFRHEIGHYYWDRLVRDTPKLPRFRDLFGHETADYGEALKRHYATKPRSDYAELFISTYAAAHPWEDFAETFAHYLHMHDTLETAHHFGLTGELPRGANVADVHDFELLMKEWTELTIALNALNRSMGLLDAYPFAISGRVKAKLQFIHELVGRS
jgi:hypothetical protein